MPYYKRIRELREDHDMTQNDVAEYLGMKQPQYFRYENGNCTKFQPTTFLS